MKSSGTTRVVEMPALPMVVKPVIVSILLLLGQGASSSPEDDQGDMIPVTIRPVLADGERPIFTAQSFRPSSDLSLCSVYEWKGSDSAAPLVTDAC